METYIVFYTTYKHEIWLIFKALDECSIYVLLILIELSSYLLTSFWHRCMLSRVSQCHFKYSSFYLNVSRFILIKLFICDRVRKVLNKLLWDKWRLNLWIIRLNVISLTSLSFSNLTRLRLLLPCHQVLIKVISSYQHIWLLMHASVHR